MSPRLGRNLVVSLVLGGIVLGLVIVARYVMLQTPGDVMVDGHRKKTVGTVRKLTSGDVACYVTLEDDRGVAFVEMADFTLCDQESIVGKRVRLSYRSEPVMAAECHGDPACRKTTVVPLIASLAVLSR